MSRKLILAVILVLAIAASMFYLAKSKSEDRLLAGKVFRIGYEHSPPYQLAGANGAPMGPAVDLLAEAARRRNIRLQWVRAEDGPDKAFAEDRVDLWPLVGIDEERQREFFITRPWRITRIWLVTRAKDPLDPTRIPRGSLLGVGWGSVIKRYARRALDTAVLKQYDGTTLALAGLCAGEVEAVLLQDPPADRPIGDVPGCELRRLSIRALVDAEFGYGIGASWRTAGATSAAKLLREEIGAISRDGTLATIYFQWFRNTSKEVYVVEQLFSARNYTRHMILAMGLVTLAMLLLLLQTARLEKARNQAQQASADAKSASQAKSEFLSRMSHELRTPLNGVVGSVDLLDRTSLDREQRELIRTLRKASRILLENINAILDFSRIEAGKVEFECVPFSPGDLVREVIDVLRPEARRKQLGLSVDGLDALPPTLLGDQARLRQVLINLVANALKFTGRGSVKVRVAVGEGSAKDSPAELSVEVSDTGEGIPPDRIAALFDPFEQADVSTTRRFGGSGLGLAISRHFVEGMGGRIGCKSSPGQGATFWFSIPFVAAEISSQPANTPERGLVAPGNALSLPRDYSKARVLLVEDNPMNRKIAARMLKQMGIVPDLSPDGEHAVRLASQRLYQLILMDCMMPGVDGFEATRKIREMRLVPRPAIVALTANAFAEDREDCLRSGMDDHLGKPFTIGELAAIVRRWLPREGDALPPEDGVSRRAEASVIPNAPRA